jgi:hypothetical protein
LTGHIGSSENINKMKFKVSDSENKENNIDISNSELVPLSNSQFDNLVSDLCNDDSDFDDILKTFDTIKMINVNVYPV